MNYIVGIDFDNTLVNYDDVLSQTARRMGFIGNGGSRNKKYIRDQIRRLPDGEIKWQKVQAHVYGKAMERAVLIEGVGKFLKACRAAGLPVYIVSHKTRFAAQDTEKKDLRRAALDWMARKGFFDLKGLGFSADQVFFEATRREKIDRIKKLNCTHFIDDLEETFLEKEFPGQTAKILYGTPEGSARADMTVLRDWEGIYEYFFSRKK